MNQEWAQAQTDIGNNIAELEKKRMGAPPHQPAEVPPPSDMASKGGGEA